MVGFRPHRLLMAPIWNLENGIPKNPCLRQCGSSRKDACGVSALPQKESPEDGKPPGATVLPIDVRDWSREVELSLFLPPCPTSAMAPTPRRAASYCDEMAGCLVVWAEFIAIVEGGWKGMLLLGLLGDDVKSALPSGRGWGGGVWEKGSAVDTTCKLGGLEEDPSTHLFLISPHPSRCAAPGGEQHGFCFRLRNLQAGRKG